MKKIFEKRNVKIISISFFVLLFIFLPTISNAQLGGYGSTPTLTTTESNAYVTYANNSITSFSLPSKGQNGNISTGNGNGYTVFRTENGQTYVEQYAPDNKNPNQTDITGAYLVDSTTGNVIPGKSQTFPNGTDQGSNTGQTDINNFVANQGGGGNGYADYNTASRTTQYISANGSSLGYNGNKPTGTISQPPPQEFTCIGRTFTIQPDQCAAEASQEILKLAAFVLYGASLVFDIAMWVTMNISTFVRPDSPYGLKIVTQGWQILRDVANLGLMFVLLYIAFATILRSLGYSAKRTLISVIIVAILMNFSFFFASVVIDASNVMTVFLYNSINPSAQTKENGQPVVIMGQQIKGISGIFLQGLGMITIYNTESGAGGQNGTADISGNLTNYSTNTWTVAVVGIGGSLLMLVTSFVLVAASVMFIFRTVILIGVLMFSSIAIAAYALPQTKGIFDKWLSYLIRYSFFAPVYLLMLYLVTAMIKSTGATTNASGQALPNVNFGAMLAGNAGAFSSIFTFAFLIALMIGSLIIASSFGVYGADKAKSLGRGIVNRGRDIVVRNTLNRGARLANAGYDNAVTNTRLIAGSIANNKYIAGTLKNKYVKRTLLGGRIVAGAVTLGGTELARAGIREGAKSLDQGVKAQLKSGEEFKMKDGRNLGEVEKADKARGEEIKKNIEKAKVGEAIQAGIAASEEHEKMKDDTEYKKADNKKRIANEASISKMQTAITSMSEQITEQSMSTLMKTAVLETLTDRQLDAIMKNTEKYGEVEKKEFIAKKFSPLQKKLDEAFKLREDAKKAGLTPAQIADLEDKANKKEDEFGGDLQKLSEKQLELAGPDFFFSGNTAKDEVKMKRLKGEQSGFLTDKNKAQGYSRVQKEKIGEVQGRPLKRALEGSSGPVANAVFSNEQEAINEVKNIFGKGMKPVDVAKMGDALKNPRVLRNITNTVVLQKMVDESSPDLRDYVTDQLYKMGTGNLPDNSPGNAPSLTPQEVANAKQLFNWTIQKGNGFSRKYNQAAGTNRI